MEEMEAQLKLRLKYLFFNFTKKIMVITIIEKFQLSSALIAKS